MNLSAICVIHKLHFLFYKKCRRFFGHLSHLSGRTIVAPNWAYGEVTSKDYFASQIFSFSMQRKRSDTYEVPLEAREVR